MTRAIALLVFAVCALGRAAADDRRSGFDMMSPQNQALQRDDMANPAMLWVQEGEALWRSGDVPNGRACTSCHGDAKTSMRGVAARYPAYDDKEGSPVDLATRVNLCRANHQDAPALAPESQPLLGLTAYLGLQSRGMPITPDANPRATPFRERGRALYSQRIGQLNLSCAQCHDDLAGRRLGGSTIPQAHPTGYPLYRLEWQALGSLQRRFRNCMTGVRAEALPFGASDYVALEMFLASRAAGLALEIPAVRP